MKIILVIARNKELVKNISSIKLQNYNVVILNNIKFIKHYLEEYIPEFIILSEEFENREEIADYMNVNTQGELFIIGSGDKRNTISRNIYLGGVKNTGDLERVLRIIDNLDSGDNISIKNNYKIIPQQVISFYSIQGGVGKTSIVFNFAWYVKKIIEGRVLNIDMLDSIIYSARNKYDIIIADIPFRYDNISLEMLNLSTTSILVLSPDMKLVPRINDFKKFLPAEQKKGIIFNKVSQSNKKYIDECKNISGIPVYDRISHIPEENIEKIANGRVSFNILNLQSLIPDLVNSIF